MGGCLIEIVVPEGFPAKAALDNASKSSAAIVKSFA